ncbi:MAG: hypothetical protein ACI4KL_01615 [Lentihominibacter sp.]
MISFFVALGVLIAGFHATQSPLVAKCITSEKQGRSIIYGAMIAEAVIALVWAAAGTAFYDGSGDLLQALTDFGQSAVVYDISKGVLGSLGGILAIIGVVACPITSGDTAFRSARLILAEWSGLSQDKLRNRLLSHILSASRRHWRHSYGAVFMPETTHREFAISSLSWTIGLINY